MALASPPDAGIWARTAVCRVTIVSSVSAKEFFIGPASRTTVRGRVLRVEGFCRGTVRRRCELRGEGETASATTCALAAKLVAIGCARFESRIEVPSATSPAHADFGPFRDN